MNKKELVEQIAEFAELKKTQAELALNSILAGITQSLKKRETVSLVGFGSFSTSRREAKKGRNPQNEQNEKGSSLLLTLVS